MFLLSIVADGTSLYYVQWSITHTASHLAPQIMADRTNNRDGGLENGHFFHPVMSPRQANKRPDGRTVEMYLDVLSKIIAYIYPRFIMLILLYVTKPSNTCFHNCIHQLACCKFEVLHIYDL